MSTNRRENCTAEVRFLVISPEYGVMSTGKRKGYTVEVRFFAISPAGAVMYWEE